MNATKLPILTLALTVLAGLPACVTTPAPTAVLVCPTAAKAAPKAPTNKLADTPVLPDLRNPFDDDEPTKTAAR